MVSEEQNSEMELASEVVPVPEVQSENPEVVNEANNKGDNEANNKGDNKANNVSRRKPRQRKNALHAAILKQMEFYFSDSNLSKDRFLGELVKKDPFVDLDIFLKCNKISSLTDSKTRIVKALKKSTMLKVSEDGMKVCRTTPIVEKQNIDDCTVYVQRLPQDVDHEFLSTIFSEYGPVAYVSIPKYKYSKKNKGFGFIEFNTPKSAQKCLKAFRKKGFELPCQTSPTEVLSITTFAEEEKQEPNLETNLEPGKLEKSKKKKKKNKKIEDKSNTSIAQPASSKSASDSNTDTEERRGKKRKNKNSSELSEVESEIDQKNTKEGKKPKKLRLEEPEIKTESVLINKSESNLENLKESKKMKRGIIEETNETESLVKDFENPAEGKKAKRFKSETLEGEAIESETSVKNESDTEETNDENAKKSNDEDTNEKKKKKKRKRTIRSQYEPIKALDIGLQIMGKKEWKKLRNRYLDLQRAKMKELKQHMTKVKWNQWGDRSNMEAESEEITNNQKENSGQSSINFTPGVIVKIDLQVACVDLNGFKTDIRKISNNTSIQYIDIKEGSNQAFVRCSSSDAAEALIQKAPEDKSFKILNGEEEAAYWEKIKQDREDKITNKVRVKQRGRNKLLKRAEKELGKHIKFDEV